MVLAQRDQVYRTPHSMHGDHTDTNMVKKSWSLTWLVHMINTYTTKFGLVMLVNID